MSKENLIYNFGGKDYYERVVKEDGTFLYEGRHGKYVGNIIVDEVYNINTGEYLGEIIEDRLIVDLSKVGVTKITANRSKHRFGRCGHACIANAKKLTIPKGYEDFTIGLR